MCETERGGEGGKTEREGGGEREGESEKEADRQTDRQTASIQRRRVFSFPWLHPLISLCITTEATLSSCNSHYHTTTTTAKHGPSHGLGLAFLGCRKQFREFAHTTRQACVCQLVLSTSAACSARRFGSIPIHCTANLSFANQTCTAKARKPLVLLNK